MKTDLPSPLVLPSKFEVDAEKTFNIADGSQVTLPVITEASLDATIKHLAGNDNAFDKISDEE